MEGEGNGRGNENSKVGETEKINKLNDSKKGRVQKVCTTKKGILRDIDYNRCEA